MNPRLQDIFIKHFNLTPPLEDFERQRLPGWDSLKHVELVIEIQKKFGIHIPAKDIISISKFSDFERLIQNNQKNE